MKKILAVLVLLTLSARPVAAQGTSVVGQWKAEFDTQIGLQKYLYTIKQEGAALTGAANAEVGGEKVLTHHHLKNRGQQDLPLNKGETPKLPRIGEAGSGAVHERERAWLREIIEKVNDLFDGDLSENDKLVYVNNVIKGKLLESATLQQQAATNSKEQFANSPDLKNELMNGIMDALDAHTLMSTQALNSALVRGGIKDILLNHAQLYETLRGQAEIG
jgi:type I restriction enzyme R subunit